MEQLKNLANHLRHRFHNEGYTTFQKRLLLLEKLKNSVKLNESNIIHALKLDLGKSTFESYATEVGFILEEIGYVLSHLESWAFPKKVKTPMTLFPGKSFIHQEPFGAVLIISPWNYPFQLCLSPLIGAVAAGNRVVVKPSEFAINTNVVIKKILDEVFTDEEVILVEGALEETQILLGQKWDYIFFTGSTMVGKVIMKAAAEFLTPVTLELGGKSPCIIEDSANLDLAAKRIVWGKFLNAGQTCVAPDYVLVPEQKQNEFISRVEYYLNSFYGEGVHSSADYSRIISEKHLERLKGLIVEHKVAIGGISHKEDRFLSPTIMKDVSWDDKVMEDEIFGPILPVIPYRHFSEVFTKILELPKPLALYLFTQNEEKKKEVIKKIPFGGGCINDTVIHLANPNLPFGGVGTSGIGSYHGKKSFETFSHTKSVFEQSTSVDVPLRYPPYKDKLRWLKLFIR